MSSHDAPLPGAQPSLLGNAVLTGWIGKDPRTGSDFPFLMLYNPGDGDLGRPAGEAAMTEILAGWGVRPGNVVSHPHLVGGPVPLHVRVRLVEDPRVEVVGIPGLSPVLPVNAEWAGVAAASKEVMFVVAGRVWPQGPSAGQAQFDAFTMDPRTISQSVLMLAPASVVA
ncbi:DUF5949 family protein [Kitasatospora sp. NPDC094028]